MSCDNQRKKAQKQNKSEVHQIYKFLLKKNNILNIYTLTDAEQ